MLVLRVLRVLRVLAVLAEGLLGVGRGVGLTLVPRRGDGAINQTLAPKS